MTKQQKLGACFGGAFGVAALALGWFFYSAYADRQAALDGDAESGKTGLTAEDQKNEGFYQQSNPFPSPEAISTVESNKAEYAKWRAEIVKLAASGDCPKMSENMGSGSTFKIKYLQAHVNEMLNWKISAGDFLFGFEQYLGKDNRTTPDPKDFPMLYSQLTTITNVVDLFKQCKVSQIRAIKREQGGGTEEPEDQNAKRRKKAAKNKPEKVEVVPKPYDYRFDFVAHPSSLLDVLNKLAKSSRFYVVSELGFEREGDSLMSRLTKSSENSSGGRRGKKEQVVEGSDVTNPKSDLILVHMKLSVYDFGTRSGSENAEAAAGSPKKEGK